MMWAYLISALTMIKTYSSQKGYVLLPDSDILIVLTTSIIIPLIILPLLNRFNRSGGVLRLKGGINLQMNLWKYFIGASQVRLRWGYNILVVASRKADLRSSQWVQELWGLGDWVQSATQSRIFKWILFYRIIWRLSEMWIYLVAQRYSKAVKIVQEEMPNLWGHH